MARAPRRIVTALDADGMSYIARVEEIPAEGTASLPPDVAARSYPNGVPEVRVVWDCEQLPAVLPADPEARPSGRLPGAQGVRVSVTTLPPGWQGETFWSNRVDVLWVLSGELTYVTDRGDEVVLAGGDLLVQNGVNKAFHNRGDEPVQLGAVMVGAVQSGATPPLDRYHGPHEDLRYRDAES
jgi:uncharacterized cupin superfamily protein